MSRHMRWGAVLAMGLYGCSPEMRAEGRRYGFMDTFSDAEREKPHVQARSLPSPHPFTDGQWQGIIAASDGFTYFSFSSHHPERNAQFYRYHPDRDRIEHVIDVGTWCGETDTVGRRNTQGKLHSEIYEVDGMLYMSSTSGGGQSYKGGHFLAYNLETGECINLGHYPDSGGGLLTMHYEPVFKRLYAISQTDQTLVYYDMDTGKIVEIGPVEDNPHQTRRLISDRFGNVYGSTWGDRIYRYNPVANTIAVLHTVIPHDPTVQQPPTPNFGRIDAATGAWERVVPRGAYRDTRWQNLVWDPVSEWWYGVRVYDSYLFRFRPPEDGASPWGQIEGIASFSFRPEQPVQTSSLGMVLMDRTIYYCSYPTWNKMAHLMSYQIDDGVIVNHGPIVLEDGRRVSEMHGIAVGSDGKLHGVGMVWSIEDDDPANDHGQRAQAYIHCRLVIIDPGKDFR